MIDKADMYAKFENLDDLNLSTNLLIIQELASKWSKQSDNEDINKLRDAIIQVSLLTNKLQLDRGNYHLTISQYRSESLRLVERARKAEDKVKELEEQIKKYETKVKLGL